MSVQELDEFITNARNWLFEFCNHKKSTEVRYALHIALTAKELEENEKIIIDTILKECYDQPVIKK
jgi:hypothetical protein